LKEHERDFCKVKSVKLVVMNDESHPHSIEIQYYLLKDGEGLRQYLADSKRTLDYSADVNIQLSELLKRFVPNGNGTKKVLPSGSENPFMV